MYRDYQHYEQAFERMTEQAPEGVILRKLSWEEFHEENYKDKVEFYLMEEWCLPPFHEIFFSGEDHESEERTPADDRGEMLHGGVHDILDHGYENKWNVVQTAAKILEFLKNQSAI